MKIWNSSQKKIPLVYGIENHIQKKIIPFHVPGHMNGNLIPNQIKKLFGKKIFKSDLTEIPEMDNLHKPEGVINEAQDLTAEAFGVKKTFFLVGGSSAGIKAMMMSTLCPGDKVIIERNSHKSTITSVILGGYNPVFIENDIDEKLGIPNPVELKQIENTIKNNSDAKAILITSPNYFGQVADIQKISKICRKKGLKILVDEAHGAHLKFHPRLPKSAVECDVDMVTQSAHKTLPALTQGAYLHVVSDLKKFPRLASILSMVQTSSPSYPIMAGLDVCRNFMALHGKKHLSKTLKIAKWLREKIKTIDGIFSPEWDSFDETKLLIDISELGFTGFEMEKKLLEQGIQIELSTISTILCVLTVATTWNHAKALIKALEIISKSHQINNKISNMLTLLPSTRLAMNPRNAFFSKREAVNLELATGKISAETICPYPPGVPILIPGEIISSEIIEYLQELQNFGGSITGLIDSSVDVVI